MALFICLVEGDCFLIKASSFDNVVKLATKFDWKNVIKDWEETHV